MNILFFSYNAYSPTRGGIARITSYLIDIFRNKGHKVIKVGHRKDQFSVVEDDLQFYLPNNVSTNSSENLTYLKKICLEYNINIIICQNPLSECGDILFDLKSTF